MDDRMMMSPKEAAQRLFKVLNHDGNAVVTSEEMRHMLEAHLIQVSDERLGSLMQSIGGVNEFGEDELVAAFEAGVQSDGEELIAILCGSIHWGYSDQEGGRLMLAPDMWQMRFPDAGGSAQSPINISREDVIVIDEEDRGSALGALGDLDAQYSGTIDVVLTHTGHTVAAKVPPGNVLTGGPYGDHTYDMFNIHYHTPAEHAIENVLPDAVFHFVHARSDIPENMGVVAIFFTAQSDEDVATGSPPAPPHPFLSAWLDGIAHTPTHGDRTQASLPLDSLDLSHSSFVTYSGSLTTPPCSEIVTWVVSTTPIIVPKSQIKALESHLGFPNNRPLQPVNARPIRCSLNCSLHTN